MCGIAAIFQPGRMFAKPLLDAIEADLYHRGPDSGGQLAEDGMALVFRRLSIIDPIPDSDQPMNDSEGRYSIVFNGEIYNFKALRDELIQAGVRFRTHSDTEVILNGYIRWGNAVFERLEGMFALVIIDRHRNLAIAARDPYGIKPLYMAAVGDLTVFASEARVLHRFVKPVVDETALRELVAFGWAAGRLSNYRNIEMVPGGTIVTVSLSEGTRSESRYLDPLDLIRQTKVATESDARAALQSSIRIHLTSDVGVSVQLSGGVDSSLVAAISSEESLSPLTAYSLGLGTHAYDETPFQKVVVDKYGLQDARLTVDGAAYADALPKAIHHMEGPTPHGGCTLIMMLCGEIRKNHKVVLTGEGADEAFGGYQRYATWLKTAWQERLARILPTAQLPRKWPFASLKRLAGRDAAAWSGVYHDIQAVERVLPALVPSTGAREQASGRFQDFRDRLFAVDQSSYLQSLLTRQDKMSMAMSVEARVPFVHLPLLRTINALPKNIRVPGTETKPVLKRIAEQYLPTSLVRRRKIGLWLPYEDWYQDERLAGRYLENLTEASSRLATYAEPEALKGLVENFRRKERSAGLVLQRLVEIELWLRSAENRPSGPCAYEGSPG